MLSKDVYFIYKQLVQISGLFKAAIKKINRVWAWDLGKYAMISEELLILAISQNNDEFSYLLSQGWKNKNCSY